MNLIEMDIDDSFDFYCPKTGKMILGPDYFEVSEASAFCYSPEANDFELIADEYQPLWQKIEAQYGEEELGDDVFNRFCGDLLKEHPNLVIFGFTTRDIACGPVANTIYVCIDFAFDCYDPE
jgi:hypothetical protein